MDAVDPAKLLLDWFDLNHRKFPWREVNTKSLDPYKVWLSEIMLQQTTTNAVIPYFENFVIKWPTVKDLASSQLDTVLHAWQGLGYYARARNLHKCAKIVAKDFRGNFPTTEEELIKLPGVGPYTAAAIAAIAFNKFATAVDGNVERVIARLYCVGGELSKIKNKIKKLAVQLTPSERCGDYAQAVMDLGATVCTPRNPSCIKCPWNVFCKAYLSGNIENYPERTPKKRIPTRRANIFFVLDKSGRVFIRRREESGLLGGLMEFPSSAWVEATKFDNELFENAPKNMKWQRLPGTVRHKFTHFQLELRVFKGVTESSSLKNGEWCTLEQIETYALPTLMKKVWVYVEKNSSK